MGWTWEGHECEIRPSTVSFVVDTIPYVIAGTCSTEHECELDVFAVDLIFACHAFVRREIHHSLCGVEVTTAMWISGVQFLCCPMMWMQDTCHIGVEAFIVVMADSFSSVQSGTFSTADWHCVHSAYGYHRKRFAVVHSQWLFSSEIADIHSTLDVQWKE
jgi:hypothetical protein